MKAQQYGTPTEHLRWSAGWKSPQERRESGTEGKCCSCRYLETGDYLISNTPRCRLLGVETKAGAICNRWSWSNA